MGIADQTEYLWFSVVAVVALTNQLGKKGGVLLFQNLKNRVLSCIGEALKLSPIFLGSNNFEGG